MLGADRGPNRRRANAEARRRVTELVRLRMASDIPALLRLFAEDVQLSRNCWTTGLFDAGNWRGKDALKETLRRAEIDFEPLDAEILTILVDGDRAAMRWVSLWRHRATGETYTMDMAHFLRWRGGLVTEMIEFMDHHCESQMAAFASCSLDEMVAEREPGLDKAEMARRVVALGNFSRNGPDIGLFRNLCAPQVLCEFVGSRASIAYAGRHRGIDSLVRIIRSIGVEFEQLGHAAPQVVIEGCCAAVRRTVEWRHRGTGRRGLVELADFIRFENGLIIEMIEFRDSVALLAD